MRMLNQLFNHREVVMLAWIVRILFIVSGFITSFFVSRDELNFDFIQMVVAILLFTLIILIFSFWGSLFVKWIKKMIRKK